MSKYRAPRRPTLNEQSAAINHEEQFADWWWAVEAHNRRVERARSSVRSARRQLEAAMKHVLELEAMRWPWEERTSVESWYYNDWADW